MGGRQIVMLHGQPGLGSDWQQLADLLPPGLAVTAVDRPGLRRQLAAGRRVRRLMPEPSSPNWTRGTSTGPCWSVTPTAAASNGLLATLAPERVEALVLLASIGPGVPERLGPAAGRAGDRGIARRGRLATDPVARPGLADRQLPAARAPALSPASTSTCRSGRPRTPDHGSPWRTFLTEQRALTQRA